MNGRNSSDAYENVVKSNTFKKKREREYGFRERKIERRDLNDHRRKRKKER